MPWSNALVLHCAHVAAAAASNCHAFGFFADAPSATWRMYLHAAILLVSRVSRICDPSDYSLYLLPVFASAIASLQPIFLSPQGPTSRTCASVLTFGFGQSARFPLHSKPRAALA